MKRVEWSRRASLKVLGIWDWNVEQSGTAWADRYVDDLRQWVEALGNERSPGRPVAADPSLRYANFRKVARGAGHIVVFRIDDETIRITDLFHTAQDWRMDLEEP